MSEYKRFTERRGGLVIDKCGNCPNVNNLQGCTDKKCYEIMKNRLAELEDKIESGRLVELPKPFIEQQKEEPYAWQVFHAKVDIFAAAGKDIFPKENKESAEARLKELQEKQK